MSHSYTSRRLRRGLLLFIELCQQQQTYHVPDALRWLESKTPLGHQQNNVYLNREIRKQLECVLKFGKQYLQRLEGEATGLHVWTGVPLVEQNCKCELCRRIRAMTDVLMWLIGRLRAKQTKAMKYPLEKIRAELRERIE